MQKKVFWLIFTVLCLAADFVLPLMWGIVAMLPLVVVSWWITYRTGWFD